MKRETYLKMQSFIYKNARPLDLYRWQVHFEGGNPLQVVHALGFYQNEDGGFGHGLEPDNFSPHSTPITTNHAIEMLKEIGFQDKHHPMVTGILSYLASGKGKHQGRWLFSVPETLDYPHAPWWNPETSFGTFSRYNPTAPLLRFILDFGDYASDLYLYALNELEKLKKDFMEEEEPSMHDLIALASLRPYLDEEHLHALEEKHMEKDPQKFQDYVLRPTLVIEGKEHPLYEKLKPLVEKDLDDLESQIKEEGFVDINWAWGSYPEEFPVARHQWRSHRTIKTLLLLKAFGRWDLEE